MGLSYLKGLKSCCKYTPIISRLLSIMYLNRLCIPYRTKQVIIENAINNK